MFKNNKKKVKNKLVILAQITSLNIEIKEEKDRDRIKYLKRLLYDLEEELKILESR